MGNETPSWSPVSRSLWGGRLTWLNERISASYRPNNIYIKDGPSFTTHPIGILSFKPTSSFVNHHSRLASPFLVLLAASSFHPSPS